MQEVLFGMCWIGVRRFTPSQRWHTVGRWQTKARQNQAGQLGLLGEGC